MIELTFDTVILLLWYMRIFVRVILFFFYKFGFAPLVDTRNANYRAGCREKVDNFNPIWSPHNKVGRSLKHGWLEEIGCKFWRFMLIHAGILCCAGVQINIQIFVLKSFWSIVDHSGISRSPLQAIFYRNICTTTGFAVMLVFPTLMYANFKISNHGVFFRDPGARNRLYTTVNHSAFKTYPKISNSKFLSKS